MRVDVEVNITGYVTVEAENFQAAYGTVSAYGKTGGREVHEILDQLSHVSIGMRGTEIKEE